LESAGRRETAEVPRDRVYPEEPAKSSESVAVRSIVAVVFGGVRGDDKLRFHGALRGARRRPGVLRDHDAAKRWGKRSQQANF
jgi:hypothetical protein